MIHSRDTCPHARLGRTSSKCGWSSAICMQDDGNDCGFRRRWQLVSASMDDRYFSNVREWQVISEYLRHHCKARVCKVYWTESRVFPKFRERPIYTPKYEKQWFIPPIKSSWMQMSCTHVTQKIQCSLTVQILQCHKSLVRWSKLQNDSASYRRSPSTTWMTISCIVGAWLVAAPFRWGST